jgi:hypothetical protein
MDLSQLMEYKTFRDMGTGHVHLPDYQFIKCHIIYAVKHDGRHKARFVAGGHLTTETVESVYSGVVSIRGLCLVMLLNELNGLEIYTADVGNAYLEAYTREKVAFVAGPEFKPFGLYGNVLIIEKALYGLHASGQAFEWHFADTMRAKGFKPYKAEPSIWMKRNDNIWEYVCVYVDDLAIAMKNPQPFLNKLQDPENSYGYKLKSVGPIEFHLGCDFGRDPNGTL